MKKDLFFNIFLVLIFILSFYLRLDAYLINNSFFTDEILLAQNIFERSYIGLLFPLYYFQSAPFLFLVAEKLFISFVGINELSFRFIPFLSSLISVYLFYLVVKEIFQTRIAKIVALFTFGISYQLLFYAQVFKQYSTDVLITLSILLISIKILRNELTGKMQIGIAGIWLFCVLFSFPACITIVTVAIASCIYSKCKDKSNLSLIPANVYILFYGIIHLNTSQSEYLLEYWKKGFAIFSSEIYKINFDFLFHYYSHPSLLLILLIIGFYYLYKRNRLCFVQILSTFILTLILAYLKIYPFERRLILFLLPFLIIVSVFPLDNLKRNWLSFLCVVLSLIFFGSGYLNFTKEFVSGNVSYLRQDVKPILSVVTTNCTKTPLYLYYGSLTAYSYYSKLYKLPKAIIGTYPKDENLSKDYLLSDLEHLNKGSYYLMFVKGTWTYDKDLSAFKDWVTKNAVLLEEYNLKSAFLAKILIK